MTSHFGYVKLRITRSIFSIPLDFEITRLTCIYDPLGYAAPVTLQGKLFLRNFLSGTIDRDEPVTEELHRDWEAWCFSLAELKKLQIPRSYFTVSFIMEAPSKKVHVFVIHPKKL